MTRDPRIPLLRAISRQESSIPKRRLRTGLIATVALLVGYWIGFAVTWTHVASKAEDNLILKPVVSFFWPLYWGHQAWNLMVKGRDES